MKERDGARIERAARQFVSSNDIIENQIDSPTRTVAPGWYPDKESVLATAISDKHEDMLAQMLAHDQEVMTLFLKVTLVPRYLDKVIYLHVLSNPLVACISIPLHVLLQQKMVEVMKKLDKVHSKSNYAKSIAMATDAIEQNETFVRNLYGGDIPCELHSCAIDFICVGLFLCFWCRILSAVSLSFTQFYTYGI